MTGISSRFGRASTDSNQSNSSQEAAVTPTLRDRRAPGEANNVSIPRINTQAVPELNQSTVTEASGSGYEIPDISGFHKDLQGLFTLISVKDLGDDPSKLNLGDEARFIPSGNGQFTIERPGQEAPERSDEAFIMLLDICNELDPSMELLPVIDEDEHLSGTYEQWMKLNEMFRSHEVMLSKDCRISFGNSDKTLADVLAPLEVGPPPASPSALSSASGPPAEAEMWLSVQPPSTSFSAASSVSLPSVGDTASNNYNFIPGALGAALGYLSTEALKILNPLRRFTEVSESTALVPYESIRPEVESTALVPYKAFSAEALVDGLVPYKIFASETLETALALPADTPADETFFTIGRIAAGLTAAVGLGVSTYLAARYFFNRRGQQNDNEVLDIVAQLSSPAASESSSPAASESSLSTASESVSQTPSSDTGGSSERPNLLQAFGKRIKDEIKKLEKYFDPEIAKARKKERQNKDLQLNGANSEREIHSADSAADIDEDQPKLSYHERIAQQNKERDFTFTPDLQDLLSLARTGKKSSPFKKRADEAIFFNPRAELYVTTEYQSEDMRIRAYGGRKAFDQQYQSALVGPQARHKRYNQTPLLQKETDGEFSLSFKSQSGAQEAAKFICQALWECKCSLQAKQHVNLHQEDKALPYLKNDKLYGSAEAWMKFDAFFHENKARITEKCYVKSPVSDDTIISKTLPEILGNREAVAEKTAALLNPEGINFNSLPILEKSFKAHTPFQIKTLRTLAADIFQNLDVIGTLTDTGLRYSKQKAAKQKFAYIVERLETTADIYEQFLKASEEAGGLSKASMAAYIFADEIKPLLDITHKITTFIDAKAGDGLKRSEQDNSEKSVFVSQRTKDLRAAFGLAPCALQTEDDIQKLHHEIRKDLNILENRVGKPLIPLRSHPKAARITAGGVFGASMAAHIMAYFTPAGPVQTALQAVAGPAALSSAAMITPITEAVHHLTAAAFTALLGGGAKLFSVLGDKAVNTLRRNQEPIHPFQKMTDKSFEIFNAVCSFPVETLQKAIKDVSAYGLAAPDKWHAECRPVYEKLASFFKNPEGAAVTLQEDTLSVATGSSWGAQTFEEVLQIPFKNMPRLLPNRAERAIRRKRGLSGVPEAFNHQKKDKELYQKPSAKNFIPRDPEDGGAESSLRPILRAEQAQTQAQTNLSPVMSSDSHSDSGSHEHDHDHEHGIGEPPIHMTFSESRQAAINYALEKTGAEQRFSDVMKQVEDVFEDDPTLKCDPFDPSDEDEAARDYRADVAAGINNLLLYARFPDYITGEEAQEGADFKTVSKIRAEKKAELSRYSQPPREEKLSVLDKMLKRFEESNLLKNHREAQLYDQGNFSVEQTINLLKDYKQILETPDGGVSPYELKLYDEYFGQPLANAQRLLESVDRAKFKRADTRSEVMSMFLTAFPDMIKPKSGQIETARLTHEVCASAVNPAERAWRNLQIVGGMINPAELPKFAVAGALFMGMSEAAGVSLDDIPGTGQMLKLLHFASGNNPFVQPVLDGGEILDEILHVIEAVGTAKLVAGGENDPEAVAMRRALGNFIFSMIGKERLEAWREAPKSKKEEREEPDSVQAPEPSLRSPVSKEAVTASSKRFEAKLNQKNKNPS